MLYEIEIIIMNNYNRIISTTAGPSSTFSIFAISALSALYVPLQTLSSSIKALFVCTVILRAERYTVFELSAGNEAYFHFYLSNFTDTRSLVNAVRNIPYCGGNTNTTGGLRLARQQIFNTANGDRPDAVSYTHLTLPTIYSV